MGLFDILAGKRRLAKPAPDRLFALSTAYVTFQTELSIATRGLAGIVFQPLATADFEQIVQEMVEVVEGTSSDSGTTVEARDDDYDYRWMILRDGDFDDLVVGVNAVSGALEAGGYGERILCAVFAFEDAQRPPPVLDLQLQARRLLPVRPGRRRPAARHRARAAAEGADRRGAAVEAELERWFPLWGIPI